MSRFLNVTTIIALAWSLFVLYTAFFGNFPALIQRSIFVTFALSLTFSMKRLNKNKTSRTLEWLDIIGIILPIVIGIYVIFNESRLSTRVYFADTVTALDIFMGVILILLVLEASRRIVGKIITFLAVFFIAYGLMGAHLNGLLSHRGLDIESTVDLMFLSTQGIFGVPIGVAMDYVFYFILFGAFLNVSGGGQLFIDIAFRLTRRTRGGPAKAAIVSSGLMGSISGSAVANVVSTGIFTIPLMKKAGYSSKDSAAIESVASTGGQIMPPIMGAAVFIMAEMVGVPYTEIILAALIPALLYYLALMFIVHLKAVKADISKTSEEVVEKQEKIINRIHLLLPMIILLSLIFYGFSLSMAAFWAIISVIATSFIRKNTFLNHISIISALEDGAKQALSVTIPCAVAGIVVGIISFSGLGLKFTSIITQWSSGNFIVALFLIALGAIIIGMGMPTTAAYIMAAILLAPALQEFNVEPLISHMFVLYFAVLSMITPPIALAAFSAAGISGSKMGETGMRALLLSIPAFLIPFAFVYSPELLLIGDTQHIIWVVFCTSLGIVGLSITIVGHLFRKVVLWMRVIFLLASIMMISQSFLMDILGISLFFIMIVVNFLYSSNQPIKTDVPT
ncbi:TRAP transporter permease [Alteribacillus sp. YIM 98480]|uniref:TRAP transporter permease n=1 Tax=Alteribacillus sp. YIM 98480 TaxID=2606599 RepID=UPI00131B8E5E|nr:TRAP transporter permease [Alteribacillus sp. YIM 98480]